jgi:SAM-dependent MidA family methyltransferase
MNYPKIDPNATFGLRKIIHELSPLSFDKYMDLCLYHPEFGYYAQEPTQVGKDGDFFTSVSCGPLFGQIIADVIARWWKNSQISGPWRIIEIGPNNAALAIDVLESLALDHPDAWHELEFCTIDPLPLPRAFQEKKLASYGPKVRCLENVASLDELPTFVYANEVLDAFPCRLIEKTAEGWKEVSIHSMSEVAPLEEQLTTSPASIPSILQHGDYPLGYRTEIRDSSLSFWQNLRSCISYGEMLWFDYGFAEPEYYAAERTRGTLRVYQQHQASENPLDHLGQCDITAHVNFTAVAREAIAAGCTLKGFEPQEFFLTKNAADRLTRGDLDAKTLRNFQTLTHPAQLGGKFHALHFSIGDSAEHNSTAMRRLVLGS